VDDRLLGVAGIRTPDQRLRVFVSSTLAELAEERRAVAEAISALRLTPVVFESGARPYPPSEVYRAYLAQSDIFIGLYWQRYGWIGPGMDISGLEDEFDLSRALPRLLYVKRPAPDREPRLADLLARIRQQARDSYRSFRTADELGRLVRDDLATLLSERFAATRPAADAPSSAPAPSATRHGPQPLPATPTTLVGRDEDVDEVAELLADPDVRLVTLTGPGGIGKSRLAVAVGERVRDRFGAGTVFVSLAAVTQPRQVLTLIARAVGAELTGMGSPLEVLVERFADGRWLLILDNLEQVVSVAGDLNELLTRCPGVTMLATSRTVLGLLAEREYPVPPLGLPADPAGVPVEELAASPAVALFVDRARAVRFDFALSADDAAAVAEICRRLEGIPLAIELAAARTRLLDPHTLLDRLSMSLDALGTGSVDLPERQRTLRATVDWSIGLLDDAERSLLETLAVFVGGWTIEAVAAVADLDEDRALDLDEALARHSLIAPDSGEPGPRLHMLDIVREFVVERLTARPDLAEIERRHADYYRRLAEQAERPLRGVGWRAWAGRLQAEAGNMAAAVQWYLTNERGPLPHLFRTLMPFWALQGDILSQAHAWVGQLLPTVDSLDPQARAELLWAAAVTAREMGDDAAALAGRERLAPLLEDIQDSYLRAVCELAVAWASAIVGDLQGVLRHASASLTGLEGQAEPFWTAIAASTIGVTETVAGRYDDALRHLTEMRELAERIDNPELIASARVQLGNLAVLRGQPEQARTLLDEALELSLATHSTRNVTLCLAGYIQLAFDGGDLEQAALLAGATTVLRRRAGLRVWPALRRGSADTIAQVREALGADRFDRLFAAGTRLNQRQAVAAVRQRHMSSRATEQRERETGSMSDDSVR
jgi:predicted ATPase